MTLPIQQTQELMPVGTTVKSATNRRYDVDWLRILALGLLIFYHTVVSFQPWARYIGFIPNPQSIEELWTLMSIVNIWRIPILFVISGMGVYFAMERRNWKQLLQDRTVRILIPFVFGFFFIVPILAFAVTTYYSVKPTYMPGPGHLWFLGNIFVYVLVLLPFFVFWKHYPENPIKRALSKLFQVPMGLFLMTIPVILETIVLHPGNEFIVYAVTWHGFWIGLVCFLIGFIFVSLRDVFWNAVKDIRWVALILAFALYLTRIMGMIPNEAQNALLGFESMTWILAILGFGSIYLNRPSGSLSYLSKAVYPVYIFHLPVQYLLSLYIIPLAFAAWIKLILIFGGTLAISLLLYEIIRRLKWIRPVFGIKLSNA